MADQMPLAPSDSRQPSDPEITTQFQARRSGGSIASLAYPTGLGRADQPHWLKVVVRVRQQNSQVAAGATDGAVYNPTNERRLDYGRAGTTAGVVGGLTGAETASGLGVLGKLFGGGIRAGVAVAATKLSGENTLQTLKATIGLGLQEPPQVDYTTTWEEQELGSVLGGGQQSSFDIAKGVAAEALKRKINVGKMGETLGVTNEGAIAAIEKGTGKIRNPYREQIFKSVGFRTFKFQYTFLPESLNEAKTVQEIIKIFKMNMLPEVAQNTFYLIYPSEFTLRYMYKSTPNKNVNQFSDCVLTDMSVKYGGNDFVTFKELEGERGMPAEITLSLSFREIVPITADRVDKEGL